MNLKEHLKAGLRIGAFTLIEGMIGVAVMGVAFVALYTAMATGFSSIRTSQENLRATQIMTEKFEAMRLYNWEQVNTVGFIPEAFTATYAPHAANQGITYTGSIRIAAAGPEPYTADMRMVTIILTWKAGKRTNTRVLNSYIGRFGLQNYVY
jgi:type II secretory pathway pseudopilin PulG